MKPLELWSAQIEKSSTDKVILLNKMQKAMMKSNKGNLQKSIFDIIEKAQYSAE